MHALAFLVLALVVAARPTAGRVSLDRVSRALLARVLLIVERARVQIRLFVCTAEPAAGRECPDARTGCACPGGRVGPFLARSMVLAKRARHRRRRAIHDSERCSLFALSPELVEEVEAYWRDAPSRVNPELAQHAAARLANRAAARLGKLLTSLLRAHRLHRVAEPRRHYGLPAHGRAAPRPLEGAQVGRARRPGRGGGDVLRRPRASPPNFHALRRGGSSLRGSALTTNLVVAPHVRWRDNRRGPS
ncbi:hypothetical protein T492DRAFT_1112335 [Pavlovales sp. CCMP2436]|nr:hypothetical protein T492DRAFT_1112335 [Pavlovales sp. CCMP2436]